MLHVEALAARLEQRHHHAEATPSSLERAAQVAVELGLAALTCRPEHLPVAAAALRQAGESHQVHRDQHPDQHPDERRHEHRDEHAAGIRCVELSTGLEFHSDRQGLPRADALVGEARRLFEQGATDLAFVLNRDRLVPQMTWADDTVSALCEDLALIGGRIRVHLDTTGLSTEQLAEAAARCERAGAWMVQTGTWHGERAGYRETQVVRRAVSDHVLVKWGYAVQTPATMLLCLSEGIDRFNAVNPATLLRSARRNSDDGWLTVPLEGVDF